MSQEDLYTWQTKTLSFYFLTLEGDATVNIGS
jgi:hypothetical protein